MGLKHSNFFPKICGPIHSPDNQVPGSHGILTAEAPISSPYHQRIVWQYQKQIKIKAGAAPYFSSKEIKHLANTFHMYYV